ncbi:MAG TPA: hypothetical protein LFW10_03230 [Rickettsia endosymbiont of Diachasma alloeum]|nr:hypothetical protein [Rickettsia endosymbiont of Diachasma alloeum]
MTTGASNKKIQSKKRRLSCFMMDSRLRGNDI